MRQCRGCSALVTECFAQVFRSETGDVTACQDCTTLAEIRNGVAAGHNPRGRQ